MLGYLFFVQSATVSSVLASNGVGWGEIVEALAEITCTVYGVLRALFAVWLSACPVANVTWYL